MSEVFSDKRLHVVSVVFLLLTIAIIVKLFVLQIIQHDYYSTFALSTQEIKKKIYPERGEIYFYDSRTGDLYPAAINRQYYNLYAVPKEIEKTDVVSTTKRLAEILQYNEEKQNSLGQKLSKSDDPYEPIEKKVDDEIMEKITAEKIKGVYGVYQEYRYYPEGELASPVLGFLGVNKDGNSAGLYGLEGYWNDELSGKTGFVFGAKGAKGSWIATAGRLNQEAENGADLVLTIDRALEYKACETLKAGMKEYEAKSASLVMIDPKTGAILAMCSLPDYDPNEYSKVKDINDYNNSNIFTPYEPGSVFKSVVMAAGVDMSIVGPNTTFTDPCERKINDFTIKNALDKCYGLQTMTGVLENSINTGMIWLVEQMSPDKMKDYIKKFGFGQKTGIALDTEMAGDISSLDKKGKIYRAVGSFGQGLTATPLQVAVAYTALANQGKMMKPYLVSEIKYSNGRVDKTEPKAVGQVISPRTAQLLTGMLISVVENHSKSAKIDGYYVAGKTGTAQIPGKGGYTEETNHTFAAYVPARDPKFVIVVKFEAPKRAWAESTTIPVFRDIAEFTLKYYGVKSER